MDSVNNVIGWTIVDRGGNYLLYDPTYFELMEDDGVIIPLVYDAGRYTIFKSESAVKEVADDWINFLREMEYHVIPLIGKIDTKYTVEDYGVDNPK